MKIAVRFLCACASFVLMSAACFAQSSQRGPSTPDERARAVKIAEELQSDPLADHVEADRAWLMRFLIEIPDIGVNVCIGILGDLGAKETGYPTALLSTMLASEAALIIQHPNQAKDPQEVYLAGVDGALNAYVAIRKKDPKYHAPKLDEFLANRNAGTLKGAVAEATKALSCK